MKILFLNRVYPPAPGATGRLLAELAAALAREGWQVTVVTGRLGDSPRSETRDGVRIERVGRVEPGPCAPWRQALGFLKLYPALLVRAWRLAPADIVVTMTDPPLLQVLGPLLAWRRRSGLVHWSQDLHPEIAEELGIITPGGWLAAMCRHASNWALARHDRIVAVGRCMEQRLRNRRAPRVVTEVIPNWAPPMDAGSDGASFRREHRLEGRFVVMYSGNFGRAHAFDAILEAASRLPDIVFLFVGDGPRRAEIDRLAREREARNVRILPSQPAAEIGRCLAAADLHLVSMQARLCGLVVPSKIYGILTAGRPVIFVGPRASDVATLIERYDCGSVVAPANPVALVRTIAQWESSPESRRVAGRNAAMAALDFTPARAMEKFRDVLLRTAHEEPRTATLCPSRVPAARGS